MPVLRRSRARYFPRTGMRDHSTGIQQVEEAQTRVAETLPPDMLAGMNPAQMEAVRTLFGAGGDPTRRLHRYDAQASRIETCLTCLGRSVATDGFRGACWATHHWRASIRLLTRARTVRAWRFYGVLPDPSEPLGRPPFFPFCRAVSGIVACISRGTQPRVKRFAGSEIQVEHYRRAVLEEGTYAERTPSSLVPWRAA
jgi:hypothetical protein